MIFISIQFCGNNPETLATAAKIVENDCDAIDINLGCPQSIAKRGKYGAFLQEDWDLLREIGIICLKLLGWTIPLCAIWYHIIN